MKIVEMVSPKVTADPLACFFGNDEEAKKYDEQMEAAKAFYRGLLAKVSGVKFNTPHRTRDWEPFSVFSPDPEIREAWRISYFDKYGAYSHKTRSNIDDLLDDFPTDGRILQVAFL